MSTFNLDKVIFEAPLHTTMAGLGKQIGMSPFMLRYNLAKKRKLELVLKILKENKKEKRELGSGTSEIVIHSLSEAK